MIDLTFSPHRLHYFDTTRKQIDTAENNDTATQRAKPTDNEVLSANIASDADQHEASKYQRTKFAAGTRLGADTASRRTFRHSAVSAPFSPHDTVQ
ncbi:hypothetical protein [Burkholderia pseudomallei]|uniref:hypothetical protein n=1 Tax=Burkholderia pseudomallei TaxID=28450 RepID=UPI0011AB84D1|nr:hypothetical protein [Burkholderia pseudomallei]